MIIRSRPFFFCVCISYLELLYISDELCSPKEVLVNNNNSHIIRNSKYLIKCYSELVTQIQVKTLLIVNILIIRRQVYIDL